MRGRKKGEKGEAGGLMALRAGAAATVARVVWEGLLDVASVCACSRRCERATSNTKTGRSSPGKSWRWKGGLSKVNAPHSLGAEEMHLCRVLGLRVCVRSQ